MAIAFVSGSTASADPGTASSITINGIIINGVNTAITVCVSSSSGQTVSTVTYDGVDLGAARWTQTIASVVGRSTGFVSAVAPSASGRSLVITFSASTDPAAAVVAGWEGVDQTTVCRAAFTATSTSTVNVSVTVSNGLQDDVVVDGVVGYSGGLTANGAQISRVKDDSISGGNFGIGMSSKALAASGSTTMDWTLGANGFWGTGALALIPAGGSTPIKRATNDLLRPFNMASARGRM